MARRDIVVRPDFSHGPGGAKLVLRIGVGMQKMDNDGLASRFQQSVRRGLDLRLLKRRHDPAGGIHAFFDLETKVARNDGFEFAPHAVGGGPGPAPELQDIAEPPGRDQAGRTHLALEDGVRRRRRAVHDEIDRGQFGGGFFEGRERPERLVIGRTGNLREPDLAGALIEQDQIGERPADIDADNLPRTPLRHRRPSLLDRISFVYK